MLDQRAKEIYESALKKIKQYKIAQRKDMETKAASIIEDIYKKHVFRK